MSEVGKSPDLGCKVGRVILRWEEAKDEGLPSPQCSEIHRNQGGGEWPSRTLFFPDSWREWISFLFLFLSTTPSLLASPGRAPDKGREVTWAGASPLPWMGSSWTAGVEKAGLWALGVGVLCWGMGREGAKGALCLSQPHAGQGLDVVLSYLHYCNHCIESKKKNIKIPSFVVRQIWVQTRSACSGCYGRRPAQI